jgi:betaine-aldehyde dehydrogenase
LGVVARVVAYNHPLLMVVAKLITPILVGNTVVLKAAEQAPLSALRAIELIGPIFPKGVVNVLAGGVACGQTLSSHPIVKKITLVGSAPIGRLIAKASAETLKLNVFELGGKNALVAYPDADIEKLVDGIVAGMNWGWCGQSCSSTTRVFLHESLHDKVLKLAVEKINSTYKPGDPLDPKTTMGTLVDLKAVARVRKYIEIGKSEGATLVSGGHAPEGAPENSCQMLPTIFADVKSEMRIAQEEIFGPVMCVLKWSDEAKLWKDVNSVEYGLTGAVYSANLTTAQKAVKKMEAGYIWVNTSSHHYPGIPFGGYKQSGKGREHSLAELYDMTQVKAVHISLQ